ncbi:PaaI family thioesterase [Pseudacidovorax sp. RU35E]|uniref:PaaI family thioesterase n=1 Tax=Pseudacidovorax sp. RU35E TaxID=1907403 RepID=UPI0009560D1A|nr:PaaI family thioesterase [Pseudacidovorax sp. RU35E]SIR51973.1 uncharacterized domain 1-containing protein [Pseudacidovorax sp. RU35E]
MIAPGIAHELIAARLLGSPVALQLGLRLAHAEPGKVQMRLPFSGGNVTEGALVHGGVIATLADVVAVATAVSAAHRPPAGGATASLAITYLSPAEGCALLATGLALRSGARQHAVRVEVASDMGIAIAQALMTVVLT